MEKKKEKANYFMNLRIFIILENLKMIKNMEKEQNIILKIIIFIMKEIL